MTVRTNSTPTDCRLCGASVPAREGMRWWCEDGSPIHCEEHFDQGGWEVSCGDEEACRLRRGERVAAAKAAKAAGATERDAQRAELEARIAAWDAERVALLGDYPAETMYGPFDANRRIGAEGWYLPDGPELVEIASANLDDPRHGSQGVRRVTLYRVEGLDAILEITTTRGSCLTWHTSESRADAWRLAWARDNGVTSDPERDVRYIGEDQRRMYALVDHA